MKYEIESKFEIEMAHKLKTAYCKECFETIHGHSYKLYVNIFTTELNADGMVVDFKKFKEIVNDEIVDKLDHALMLSEEDSLIETLKNTERKFVIFRKDTDLGINSNNPTAELIAKWIYGILYRTFSEIFKKENRYFGMKIKLYETENNCVIISE